MSRRLLRKLDSCPRPSGAELWRATPPALLVLLAALVLLAPAARAAGEAYTVESFSAAPPPELSAAVRDKLANDAVRVTGQHGILCEIWWRKAVPAEAAPNQTLGVTYGQLAEGTLVGGIRFPVQVTDYRDQQIRPGVYTLRYALNPVDGNHQGVASDRDFLLLSPAAADSSPANMPVKDLIALSRKAAGTGHPSVWSMIAADGAPATLPALVHQQDDTDNWVLFFRAQLEVNGGPSSPLTMAVVVAGHSSTL